MQDNKCLSCGLCCQHAIVPPFTPEELDLIPNELSEPIRKFWRHEINPDVYITNQLGTRVCSWFDSTTGRCKHYDLRPQECRDFQVDGEHCNQLIQISIEGKQ